MPPGAAFLLHLLLLAATALGATTTEDYSVPTSELQTTVLYDNINSTTTSLQPETTTAENNNNKTTVFKPECAVLTGDLSRVEMLQVLTDSCRYDRLLRPGRASAPLDVRVRAYVYLFQASDAQSLEFQVQLLLQMRFSDERLAYGSLLESSGVVDNLPSEVVGESELLARLWVPHLFLRREYSSQVMGTPSKDVLISVYPDGTVVYSQRMKAIVFCWMRLEKFPFDEQMCTLSLESWTYNISELLLHWEADSPVTMNPTLHLTEYTMTGMWTNESQNLYTYPGFVHGPFSGNYSSLSITFELQREIGFYMMDYYIPSMLLVVISWVSFWLDPNAVPGRTTLGTSTMLTFITLSSKTSSSLPKVSYVKASEIWFLGCTAFIFGSLVEFAFVNTIWRRKRNVELKKVNSKYILKSTLTPRTARRQIGLVQQKGKEGQPLGRSSSCPSGFDSNISSTPSLNSFQASSTSLLGVPNSTGNADGNCVLSIPIPDNNQQPPSNNSFTTMTPQEIANWIDKRSRIVFPLAFIVFNAFYWSFICLF